jgi:hypothetical protein
VTRLMAVILLLFPLAIHQSTYAEEEMKFCDTFDWKIEEIRKIIAEEQEKDQIDVYYLDGMWGSLEHFLESKISCLEDTVEAYRETANMFNAKCGNK